MNGEFEALTPAVLVLAHRLLPSWLDIRSASALRLMFTDTGRDLNARLILPGCLNLFLFYWIIYLSPFSTYLIYLSTYLL